LLMAATFHPELTPGDRRVHKAFVDLVKSNLSAKPKAS
jgi:glutamine amidotransferase PdxT